MEGVNYLKQGDNMLKIKDTALEDRPRERLMNSGANSLSNSELLAIILRSGTPKDPVTTLAKRVIKHFDNDINKLAKAAIGELTEITGIGPAKATEIVAAFELAKRIKKSGQQDRYKISHPIDAVNFIWYELQALEQEEVHVLLLDTKNYVIKKIIVTRGLIDRSNAHPREIFRQAIKENSHKIIVCHNHPSGVSTPSQNDRVLTKQLFESGKIIGIDVIDHLVIGKGELQHGEGYFSFLEDGFFNQER